MLKSFGMLQPTDERGRFLAWLCFLRQEGCVPEPLRAIERTAVTGVPAKALSGMLDDFLAICNT
jgi:hypothetical protein